MLPPWTGHKGCSGGFLGSLTGGYGSRYQVRVGLIPPPDDSLTLFAGHFHIFGRARGMFHRACHRFFIWTLFSWQGQLAAHGVPALRGLGRWEVYGLPILAPVHIHRSRWEVILNQAADYHWVR